MKYRTVKKFLTVMMMSVCVAGMTIPAGATEQYQEAVQEQMVDSDEAEPTEDILSTNGDEEITDTQIAQSTLADNESDGETTEEPGDNPGDSEREETTEETGDNPGDSEREETTEEPGDNPGDSEQEETPEEPEEPEENTREVLISEDGVLKYYIGEQWQGAFSGFVNLPVDDEQEADALKWYYVKKGIVDIDKTEVTKGKVKGTIGWWNVVKGQIVFETTIASNVNGTWFVRNGMVDFDYNGMAKRRSDNTWWYCKGGKVDFTKTEVTRGKVNGTVGWWNVEKGQVVFKTTLAANSNGTWYVKKGMVDFGYTGVAKRISDNTWWRVYKGKVNYSFRGLASNSNGTWYCYNGKVDFNYKGIGQDSSGHWYCSGGKVQTGYSGSYTDGVRKYTITNGKVTGCNYYLFQTAISLPSGGYNLSTANIGLKVIKVNQKLLGTTSARYTTSTRNAVIRFQRKHGLSATGVVNLSTWKAMGYSEDSWYNLGTYTTPIKVKNGASSAARIQAMLDTAKEYQKAGTAYRVGASGTPGTYADCSGFIYQCLYAAGINPDTNIVNHALAKYEYTSRYLAADSKLGKSVSVSNIKAGDLVFYAKNGQSTVVHIAIYAGNGKIYDSWPSIGVTYRSKYIYGYHIVKVVRAV